jgi:hypothetical protein
VPVVKSVPVTVYIGIDAVGLGNLAYDDRSWPSLVPYVASHCDATPIAIDSDEVRLWFCWDDVVSDWQAGVVKKQVVVPVYIGETEVGKAYIEIEDSFSQAMLSTLITIMMTVAMITFAVRLVIALVARRKRRAKT